jgi:hypothetical protein
LANEDQGGDRQQRLKAEFDKAVEILQACGLDPLWGENPRTIVGGNSRGTQVNDQEFTQLLHKFRDEPASTLQFQPSIEHLMDSQFCKGLDKILHTQGVKWERRKAVATLGASLPDEKGLYMFVWKPDLVFRFAAVPETEQPCWVLYVGKAGTEEGKSDTIKHRYLNEYCKYVGTDASCLWDSHAPLDREQKLARYLTLRPLEYWFLSIADVRDILVLERKLIRLLRPPLNRQHGPKIRPGKTVPAFEEPT